MMKDSNEGACSSGGLKPGRWPARCRAASCGTRPAHPTLAACLLPGLAPLPATQLQGTPGPKVVTAQRRAARYKWVLCYIRAAGRPCAHQPLQNLG